MQLGAAGEAWRLGAAWHAPTTRAFAPARVLARRAAQCYGLHRDAPQTLRCTADDQYQPAAYSNMQPTQRCAISAARPPPTPVRPPTRRPSGTLRELDGAAGGPGGCRGVQVGGGVHRGPARSCQLHRNAVECFQVLTYHGAGVPAQ